MGIVDLSSELSRERIMVFGRVAASVVQRHVKYVSPVPVGSAEGLVKDVYDQVADEMRLVIPPAQLHSAVPDLLAAYWMLMRETVLGTGVVDRGTKETVAAAVAVANVCPYCVEMHTVSMYDLATEQEAEAVAGDRIDQVSDAGLREAAAWARAAHHVPVDAAYPARLDPAARAELIGAVVCMHYLSRMVNVFLSNFLLPPGLGPAARRRFKRGMSKLLRPSLRRPLEPYRSARLLPDRPLPRSSAWAAGAPVVADTLARAYAAFEAAGERSLTPAVRAIVLAEADRWEGADKDLSAAWCEELIAGLPPDERAAGRLALLTAFSSYQVSDDVIAEFRVHHDSDAALLDVAGWAGYTVARLIGDRQGGAAAAR